VGKRGSLERMRHMACKGNVASAAVRSASAAKQNEDLLPVIADIQATGSTTPPQIANALNGKGITAARGGSWAANQVRRILTSA
jgi:hypothetical protein